MLCFLKQEDLEMGGTILVSKYAEVKDSGHIFGVYCEKLIQVLNICITVTFFKKCRKSSFCEKILSNLLPWLQYFKVFQYFQIAKSHGMELFVKNQVRNLTKSTDQSRHIVAIFPKFGEHVLLRQSLDGFSQFQEFQDNIYAIFQVTFENTNHERIYLKIS